MKAVLTAHLQYQDLPLPRFSVPCAEVFPEKPFLRKSGGCCMTEQTGIRPPCGLISIDDMPQKTESDCHENFCSATYDWTNIFFNNYTLHITRRGNYAS